MGELKPQELYVKRKVKNSWYVHVPGKDFYCKCDSEGSADLVLSSLNTRTLPDQGPTEGILIKALKKMKDESDNKNHRNILYNAIVAIETQDEINEYLKTRLAALSTKPEADRG